MKNKGHIVTTLFRSTAYEYATHGKITDVVIKAWDENGLIDIQCDVDASIHVDVTRRIEDMLRLTANCETVTTKVEDMS